MITQEENKLHKITDGAENPFRTPDGYFDQFTSRLMERLPQVEPARPKGIQLIPRIWRYAAVMVLAVGVGSALYWGQNRQQEMIFADADEQYSQEYIDEALDYALVNNNDIVEYLTDAE